MNIQEIIKTTKKPVFLIGAGVSASSGIPTFRGSEGFWTIGSKEYRPEEMATYSNYSVNRIEVWNWYKYRRNLIKSVKSNISHQIFNELIQDNKISLINQNVDGMIKGGIEVHGNIHECVCEDCGTLFEIDSLIDLDSCPKCKSIESIRPNILFFDENYNHKLMTIALDKVFIADTIFIVGSSNQCNITSNVLEYRNATIVEVNLEPTINSDLFVCMESDKFMEYYKKNM